MKLEKYVWNSELQFERFLLNVERMRATVKKKSIKCFEQTYLEFESCIWIVFVWIILYVRNINLFLVEKGYLRYPYIVCVGVVCGCLPLLLLWLVESSSSSFNFGSFRCISFFAIKMWILLISQRNVQQNPSKLSLNPPRMKGI